MAEINMKELDIVRRLFLLLIFDVMVVMQSGFAQELGPTTSFSFLDSVSEEKAKTDYQWTTNHMHVGVRWQPFIGRPANNAYDATRDVIAVDSSYVQFWVSWAAIEPTLAFTDYARQPSPALQAIEEAVEACRAKGVKVEFVFFHCPKWASESGKAGGFKPKAGLFKEYVKRMAAHFKGRVDAWQISHEANLEGMMQGADVDFVMNDILLDGAKAVRTVYGNKPARPVLISTTGMSPCEGCDVKKGLDGKGGRAVNHFYDLMIENKELMKSVDALNLNVSDHGDGYGCMDGSFVPSVWGNYDLVRRKLDVAGYRSKSVLSSESWIVWDNAGNAHDVNGDGVKNGKDAYCKAITIIGRCLERGLNTINLPWSDNSSSWAMGLTKRRDYNGRVKNLRPDWVTPANDDGPDIVTRKLALRGNDRTFSIQPAGGNVYTADQYIDVADPNHLHYYIWRWYAQISSGSDEVIRHALAGQIGNDITVMGAGFTGNERYRVSSYNRTKNRFTVLVYSSGASGKALAKVTIPARIQTGAHSNTELSKFDFRGEGFADGETYYARVITKEISIENGEDLNPVYVETKDAVVTNGSLMVTVPNLNKFTAIEFVKRSANQQNSNLK